MSIWFNYNLLLTGRNAVLGPLGNDPLAGRHPVDVLEARVLVNADDPALSVWPPDPELVLQGALDNPVRAGGPGLLPGPSICDNCGQLPGPPLGLVLDSDLENAASSSMWTLALLWSRFFFRLEKRWVSRVWRNGVLSGMTGICRIWCLATWSVNKSWNESSSFQCSDLGSTTSEFHFPEKIKVGNVRF